jgi:thymidylate kinase
VPKAPGSGQLVSVDGIRGHEVTASAKRLLQKTPDSTQGGGISTWDASSIFYELHGIREQVPETLSPQTLLLLYAADLRFRLRWQIEPALLDGQTVVAAPYVETGVAFGLAMGLPERWVVEVFRFAPKASASFWINGSSPATGTSTAGFLEFCKDDVALREEFVVKFAEHFEALERRGKCHRI